MAATLNALGIALEIVGIILALIGLAELKKEVFPGHALPYRRAWDLFRRHVLRRRPSSQVILGAGADAGARFTLRASGQVTPPRPATFEPGEGWIRYIDKRIENLEERVGLELGAIIQHLHRIDQSVSTLTTETVKGLETRMQRVIGGERGKSLDRTWWGLATTVVGLSIQFIGNLCGISETAPLR